MWKGVSEASVNPALDNASVVYDDSHVSERDLKETVRKLGYDVVENDDGEDSGEVVARLRRDFTISAVLSAPLVLSMI